MRNAGYLPHILGRREERVYAPLAKLRRWVVEAAHSWFNRFRKLHVRHERITTSHRGLRMLAAAIIALRKVGVIYG